jgi:hypothetical protein
VPLYRFPHRTILFIHIPKAGGTTVASYLRDHASVAQALFSPDMGKRRALGLPCTPQHMHGEMVRYLFGAGFIDWSFAIVRDPLERLVSEYRWRHRSVKPSEALPDVLTWFRDRRKEYATNPYILDNHIRPQNEFPLASSEIFRFEDGMDRVMRAVAERLDMPPPKQEEPRHLNSSPEMALEMSEEFVAEIRDFYKEDYRLYGY